MKKWKIVLAVISVMLLAGAGTLYYLLEVRAYETQDEIVEEVVAEQYDIALPGEESSSEDASAGEGAASSEDGSSTAAITETAEENGEGADQTAGDSNAGSTATNTTTTSKSGSTNSNSTTESDKTVSSSNGNSASKPSADSSKPKSKPSADQIAAKYEPSFRELEAQANGKIDALIGHAVGEYVAKKKSGEEVSYFYFYSKYNTAGKILERNTDSAFNYVYKALVKELKDNGYNSSAAQQYKTAYETAKKQRRTALINKAKSAL